MRRRSATISRVMAALVLGTAAVFIAALCGASQGQAQTTPDVLIAGQIESALAFGDPGWCAVTQGSSAIQRNQAAPVAVVSFPELTYFDGTTYYLLNGQARLTFKSATAGVIYFKNTSFGQSISSPPFARFSEISRGNQYFVRFSIAFPHNCTLPIFGAFEAP
jgi:hypothetical protein